MERHTFLSVLIFTLVLLAVGIMLPSGQVDRPVGLPWQIEQTERGSIRVFGIELAHTTLGEAELAFREPSKATLFAPEQGDYTIEAYFNETRLSGLKAKMVFTFDLEQTQVREMYDRGIRISTLGSGTRKVTLHPDDYEQLRKSAIATLTYIPSINLESELVAQRFGQPAARIRDPEGGAIHWLYPELGVDVVLSEEAKEVLQYLPPSQFDRVMAPLQTAGEVVN
ncbi:hypothetical protein BOW53_05460 [Solemya pervernicosa gill symbiont]|uniref:Uncharacterized protein n=2 Tax=Gammaproteobacteria incertae sedis TaxID=118884 RepID=A0A1T2L7Q8_9GAMM|nr:hypothetical protein [Candidatus Reidiella endopervernicosa]OOZ40976.1 hypothetical protein BOW53_05460 [Solemya pervernicosa gill symbiont]QKQ25025.1 hypothetical protein HUE57_01025 [Candidatus Reidiella endopervernicosa]